MKPCDSPHFKGQCCIGAKDCIGGIMWGERGKGRVVPVEFYATATRNRQQG